GFIYIASDNHIAFIGHMSIMHPKFNACHNPTSLYLLSFSLSSSLLFLLSTSSLSLFSSSSLSTSLSKYSFFLMLASLFVTLATLSGSLGSMLAPMFGIVILPLSLL